MLDFNKPRVDAGFGINDPARELGPRRPNFLVAKTVNRFDADAETVRQLMARQIPGRWKKFSSLRSHASLILQRGRNMPTLR